MSEKNSSEIDIIHLATIVVKQWKFLSRYAIAGAVIGIIIGFSTPKQYSSSVILAPEFSTGSMGMSNSLSDIASSFGIDLGSNKSSLDAIYPELYPDIFESTEFIQSLYDVPVRLLKDTTTRTYLYHKQKESRTPWWNYPKIWLAKLLKPKETMSTDKGEGMVDPYAMSRDQWDNYFSISSAINCIIDKKTSVINISVNDQDPMVAAIIADTLQLRLQKYITDYRTSKARIDVDHYQQLSAQAWENYKKVRQQYVSKTDADLNASLMAVVSKREDLENEMQMNYNIYTQTMAQLKAAEEKLQTRTPAFTIIQPAKVNPKPVSRSKLMTMLIWAFLATAAGSGVVLFRTLKNKQNNPKTTPNA